jgi:chromosome condensin MukBEF ATPase and DNA-binding subunit MukB
MEKLRLELQDLTVTSFEIGRDRAQDRRTVEAQELAPTRQTRCDTCRTLCLPYC